MPPHAPSAIRTRAGRRRPGQLCPFTATLIPVLGAPLDDPVRVARLNERTKNPLLLRGVDRQPLETLRIPAAGWKDYDYVLTDGRHALWVISMPAGYPPIPQRILCYAVEVELAGGMRYLLKEALHPRQALLLRADTGGQVAVGPLIDEPWVFSRTCRWPSP